MDSTANTEIERKKIQANAIFQLADENIDRYRKANGQIRLISEDKTPLSGVTVTITQKSQDFLFGNLVFDLVWDQPPYKPDLFKQRFKDLFNFAIFPFYWSFYEKVPGRTEWQSILPVLEWCQANNITPKGHPLVWPYSAGVPEWLYDMPEGSVESLIKARVMNIVKGFAPAIQIWDVTNEAVNHVSWDEATQPAFREKYHEIGLWRGIEVNQGFKKEIPIKKAADWVEKSLRWAYAANPAAALIVNDYNQEIDPNVRKRFYDLIAELQKRGAPISGIGLQVHPIDYWLSPPEIWETLEMYKALNLPVHITELHQPSTDHPIEGGWVEGTWTEEKQAEYIVQLYRLFFGHPAVVSINYWGLSDRNIWIRGGGLLDAEYNPKPAYNALKKLIRNEWQAPAIEVTSGSDGNIAFRGFYGKYEVIIRQPGKRHRVFPIHLMEHQSNIWEFTL